MEAAWPSGCPPVRKSRVEVPFWSLSWSCFSIDPSSTPRPCLFCLPPVWIFNLVIFICIICFIIWFRWPWKTSLGVWSIKIFVFIFLSHQWHGSYIHNLSSGEIKAWKKFRLQRDSNPWPLIHDRSCFRDLTYRSEYIAWWWYIPEMHVVKKWGKLCPFTRKIWSTDWAKIYFSVFSIFAKFAVFATFLNILRALLSKQSLCTALI